MLESKLLNIAQIFVSFEEEHRRIGKDISSSKARGKDVKVAGIGKERIYTFECVYRELLVSLIMKT